MWLSYGNRNEFKDQQFLEIEKNMLDSIKFLLEAYEQPLWIFMNRNIIFYFHILIVTTKRFSVVTIKHVYQK